MLTRKMEKMKSKQASLALWIGALFLQNMAFPVLSSASFVDQKNYYSPAPHNSGSPPNSGSHHGHSPSHGSHHGHSPSHGSGGPSHGGGGSYGGSPPENCGNPPSGGGGQHYDPTPTPPSGSGGGGGSSYSPPSSGGGYSYSPPSSDGSSYSPPSSGGYSYSPPSSDGSSYSPPSSGGYSYSPPSSGGSSPSIPTPIIETPPVDLSPPDSPSIDPGTGTGSPFVPGISVPSPPFAFDPNSPPFTCNIWGSHPTLIWGVLGYWGTVGGLFGASSIPSLEGSNMSLQEALLNTRSDPIGALYREGTASLLNSMATKKFTYTTNQVRDKFVSALSSNTAAAAQAHIFKIANEGRIPRA